MEENDNKIIVIIIGCAIVIILAICSCVLASGLVYYLSFTKISNIEAERSSTIVSIDHVEESDIEDDDDSRLEYGTIEGKIGFPSEILPSQQVCAENMQDGSIHCTEEIVGNADPDYSGNEYLLNLPKGLYRVYAEITDENYSYNYAYYTEFVTCGLSVDCDSHDVIEIEVEDGDVIEDIDPIDWYNN